MTVVRFLERTGRGLAVAGAILAAIGVTTVPRPADRWGLGWGRHQPWRRRRDWARSFRAWLGAREPLLLQPVLFPVRLLPAGPRLLSASGVLSARTELLEPLLPLLLCLLSTGYAVGLVSALDPPLALRDTRPHGNR